MLYTITAHVHKNIFEITVGNVPNLQLAMKTFLPKSSPG